MIRFDGLESTVVGVAVVWLENSRVSRLVYSGDEIVELLMSRDGMTQEQAIEYIDFNIEGLYAGPGTPIVMWAGTLEEIETGLDDEGPTDAKQ